MGHILRHDNNSQGYAMISKSNTVEVWERLVEGLMALTNSKWTKALKDAIANNTHADDIQHIRASLGLVNPDVGSARSRNNEATYQDKLSALMEAIEAKMLDKHGEQLGLQWVDTHNSQMSNGRKPDGVLMVRKPGVTNNWNDAAVCFEVKSDEFSASAPVLRGQVLADMRDMAYHQPRRYSIVFGISRGGEVNIYLCTVSKVYHATIGCLPGDGALDQDINNVILFLLVLYEQLPEDHCGFLVPKARGIFDPFCAGDMAKFDQPLSHDGVLREAQIVMEQNKSFSGRRDKLTGSRSWLYTANVYSQGKITHREVIHKLNWCLNGQSEAQIHARVVDMGVPYMPQLIDSATVDIASDKYIGEILLIGDCGEQVCKYFQRLTGVSVHSIVDIFAGYLHALLAASTGDENYYVLHRDISSGNLLVKDGKPYVIDWGCGLVAKKGELREPSTTSAVGTAPFMSIRVLCQAGYRSLLEDLESLFLVFSFCLWNRYGDGQTRAKKDEFAKMWSGALKTEQMISTRNKWLLNHKTYWREMSIDKVPDYIKRLAEGMYDLLFSDCGTFIENIGKEVNDSRTHRFKAEAWADVFKSAMDLAAKDNRTGFEHVASLCKYVHDTPDCALTSLEGVMPYTTPSNKRGWKRGLSDQSLSPESKSRKLST
ncbi:hypothetical protein EV175_000145 [Coemansia sp. RSA 1933]|nr:hypothetical protein EV175_000145 [Coemansia sp. RSA 1933]